MESGKKSNRPQLVKAIALAKRTKSKLVVAKLDGLARNVHFISGLLESKVDFVALDFPEANTFTLLISQKILSASSSDVEGGLLCREFNGDFLNDILPGPTKTWPHFRKTIASSYDVGI